MKNFLFFDPNLSSLILDPFFPSGGSTVQTLNWIEGILKTGSKVGIITNQNFENQKRLDIDFIYTFDEYSNNSKLKWITHKYWILKRQIISYNPDYLYQSGAGFITWVLSKIAKKNGIIFIHRIANDIDTDIRINSKLGFISKIFYLNGLKNADIILCQNKVQQHNIQRRYKGKSTYIIHNPIEIQKKAKIKNIKRRYIAWLGIFQHQKNLPGLFFIAKTLPMYEFKVAGMISKSENSIRIKNQIKKLQTLPNIKFVGFIPRNEISSFLEDAYLLLNTSFYEGFSNTFLESFRSGTPVVTTKKVDPDNIIEKNKLGLVGEKIKDLPKFIIRIINESGSNDLSDNCISYVFRNHDRNMLAEKLLSFLIKK